MAEMKDSGIHAIGRIPKEWNVVRTKYLSNISIGLVTTMTENYVEKEEGVPLIRNGNIRCNKIDVNGMVFLDKRFAEKNKHRQLHTGQIATVHTGEVGTSIVIPEEYDGGLGFATIQSTPYKGVSSEFLCWFCNSAAFKNQCIECSTGDGRQNLNLYDFVDLFVAIPKYDLQSKIASFLDKKCAEIDSLHTDIEKQIETLEEYKKSIITEAVTKGLNPDVEMKDSGIEWVGMIPKNWNLSRLKYELETSMKYGASEAGVEYSDDLPRYIRITDITNDNRLKTEGKLSLTEKQANGYMLEKDTVLFARSGGTVGKTFLYKPEYGKAAFAGYLISAIPDKEKMQAEWLYYFSLSNAYWDWANQIFTQATIQNIGADKYSNLPIPIPSIDIQNAIVNYLNKKCAEIDDIITDKKKQLKILEQYKKSLIYEYVTGKKEVQ